MTPEQSVIGGIDVEELKPDNGLYYYHLRTGDKHLMLTVDLSEGLAVTALENNPELVKTIGATTELYQKALSIISDLATEHNVSIYYRFSTSDEKMQAWLRAHGKGQAVLAGAEIKNTPIGIEAVLEINP